jgi:hypothetical protein
MYTVGVTMGTLDAKPDVDPAASEALPKQIEVINRALTEEIVEKLVEHWPLSFENGRPVKQKREAWRSKLWWRSAPGRVTRMLLIALVILIVIFIIVIIACGGFTFEKCKSP